MSSSASSCFAKELANSPVSILGFAKSRKEIQMTVKNSNFSQLKIVAAMIKNIMLILAFWYSSFV